MSIRRGTLYIVRSLLIPPAPTDVSPSDVSNIKIDDYESFVSISAANDSVKQVFYENNPYGWSAAEFNNQEIDVEYSPETGLCSMFVSPPKCASWEVRAITAPQDYVPALAQTISSPLYQSMQSSLVVELEEIEIKFGNV